MIDKNDYSANSSLIIKHNAGPPEERSRYVANLENVELEDIDEPSSDEEMTKLDKE
jgi:hypothetical protein